MKSTWKNFQSPSQTSEKKITEIISKLTLEEKISLLGGNKENGRSTTGLPEKGVPELHMSDGPVGVHWWTEASTTYPAEIALAASFDTGLVWRVGEALGRDSRARGIHIVLAPGVNIYRSPLCGRNFEYLGEDPFLSSRIVVEYISGMQSMGVSATVKHYAVNYQEFDRHHTSSNLDERTLREIYLPAFRAAIMEAGSGCIMTSYNPINGVHASEHPFLINEILKKEWKFDGVAMSDWDSVYDAVGPVNAGLDIEMPNSKFMNIENLLPAVRDGRVKEEVIDDKIRRVLRLAMAFGWIEHDQKDSSIPEDDPVTAAVSLDAARGSLVLLKNEKQTLPLDKKNIKKIAVIGPSSHPAIIAGGGSAYNVPFRSVSIYEGIKAMLDPSVEIINERGIEENRGIAASQKSEFFTPEGGQGLKGEYFESNDLSGSPKKTRVDRFINFRWAHHTPDPDVGVKEYSVRWTGVIKPTESARFDVLVHAENFTWELKLNGTLIADLKVFDWKKARKTIGIKLKAGKTYGLELSIRKIPHTNWNNFYFGYERSDQDKKDFQRAIDAAKGCDAVILAVGFNKSSESEGGDRTFALSKVQEKLIAKVTQKNPNTIVVLTAGGGVDMHAWLKKIKALLLAWYPGQEGGKAVAEALLGDINPSGKLPATFEKRIQDRSSYKYYHDSDKDKCVFLGDGIFTGYRHMDRKKIKALFPFGFGLSYTTFEYQNLKLSSDKFDMKNGLTVSFDIVNTGTRKGAESAQIYVRDVECTVPRPVKELKGFVKTKLAPGEKKTVSCLLSPEAVQFWHPEKKVWIFEPGDFEVLIGANCEDIRLKAGFRI